MNDPLLNPDAQFLPKKEDVSLVAPSPDAVVLITTQDSVRLKPKTPERVQAKWGKVFTLVTACCILAVPVTIFHVFNKYMPPVVEQLKTTEGDYNSITTQMGFDPASSDLPDSEVEPVYDAALAVVEETGFKPWLSVTGEQDGVYHVGFSTHADPDHLAAECVGDATSMDCSYFPPADSSDS